jgi:formate C-acetyltransferase
MAPHLTGKAIREEKTAAGMDLDPSIGSGPSFQGHSLPDYRSVLSEGIDGVASRLARAESVPSAVPERRVFHQCMRLMVDAWRGTLERYAAAAESMSAKATDGRDGELLAIAHNCRAVVGSPPRTLAEAVQLYWITFLLDGNDDGGRLDQLLWPFLRADMAEGRVSGDAACCLLTDLFFKLESVTTWGLVIGGTDADSNDACNPLTSFFLELARAFPQTHPAISLRISRKTPHAVCLQAVRTWLAGAGMPALLNDDAVVPALRRLGVAEVDARDYGVGGCIEYQIAGKGSVGGEDCQINLAKCMELALNDGVCLMTGKRMGLATGDPLAFSCFDDVLAAYRRQVEWAVERIVAGANIGQAVKSRQGTKPMRSLLIADCLARGRDMENGGAIYGHGQMLTMGLVVVADSLAVIRCLVFGDRSVSMAELVAALRSNWKGQEELRNRIAAMAPHFGNDDSRADDLAEEVARHLWSFIGRFKTRRGGPYTGLVVYFDRAFVFGRCTGATPDGRRAGEVIEDSIGPWSGRDRMGPTAMMRSASSIPQELAGGGAILNLKLDPEWLATSEGQDAAVGLARGYFSLGGQHMQVTVVRQEDLDAALRDPASWGHLIVRVGGYSSKFTALAPNLQQAIVARTMHRRRDGG